MREFILIVVIFLVFYLTPFESAVVTDSIINGFRMLNEYARKHVLFCLVPAFFIAGTIIVFLKKDTILKLLGPNTKRFISYPIAAVSGSILAVCSCTILPIFGGIYKKGAGIGPAITFLFSGPAINVAAIFLTARVLGWELGLARMISTITAAVLVGLIMELIFQEKGTGGFATSEGNDKVVKSVIFFFLQLLFLVLDGLKLNQTIKNISMGTVALSIVGMAIFGFEKSQTIAWLNETWDFAKKILPYLLLGIFFAGMLTKLLPESLVVTLLGKNDVFSSFVAALIGALMYFATLTEIPIVQALTELGMAKGPTLSLLMAGNTLSLPSMIVITKLLGKKKAFTYFCLVVCFSTLFGFLYGIL
ncbi:MAG: permease [Fervidobacterium sp.]